MTTCSQCRSVHTILSPVFTMFLFSSVFYPADVSYDRLTFLCLLFILHPFCSDLTHRAVVICFFCSLLCLWCLPHNASFSNIC